MFFTLICLLSLIYVFFAIPVGIPCTRFRIRITRMFRLNSLGKGGLSPRLNIMSRHDDAGASVWWESAICKARMPVDSTGLSTCVQWMDTPPGNTQRFGPQVRHSHGGPYDKYLSMTLPLFRSSWLHFTQCHMTDFSFPHKFKISISLLSMLCNVIFDVI